MPHLPGGSAFRIDAGGVTEMRAGGKAFMEYRHATREPCLLTRIGRKPRCKKPATVRAAYGSVWHSRLKGTGDGEERRAPGGFDL